MLPASHYGAHSMTTLFFFCLSLEPMTDMVALLSVLLWST